MPTPDCEHRLYGYSSALFLQQCGISEKCNEAAITESDPSLLIGNIPQWATLSLEAFTCAAQNCTVARRGPRVAEEHCHVPQPALQSLRCPRGSSAFFSSVTDVLYRATLSSPLTRSQVAYSAGWLFGQLDDEDLPQLCSCCWNHTSVVALQQQGGRQGDSEEAELGVHKWECLITTIFFSYWQKKKMQLKTLPICFLRKPT